MIKKQLRNLLGLYYKEGKSYQILTGSLRGSRLYYDHTVGYRELLGRGEADSFHLLTKLMHHYQASENELVICDVGANIGLYSLWFSRQTSASSVIYAFEPVPDTASKLRANLSLNHANTVIVEEKACANHVGEISFFLGNDHHTSSLDKNRSGSNPADAKEITVATTTLDHFFSAESGRKQPDIIKMDIEGGGTVALKGCEQVIIDKRPLFLIESHSPDEDLAISNLILTHNYDAFRLNNKKWVQHKDQTHPDSEGVWGTMLLCPTGSEIASIIA